LEIDRDGYHAVISSHSCDTYHTTTTMKLIDKYPETSLRLQSLFLSNLLGIGGKKGGIFIQPYHIRMKTHITISGRDSDKILNQHWEWSGQERGIVGWSGHVGT